MLPDVCLELLLESAEDGSHVVSGGGVLTVEMHDALLQEVVLCLRVVAEVVSKLLDEGEDDVLGEEARRPE